MKDVRSRTAEQQLEAVRKKLMELNSGFDVKMYGDFSQTRPPTIENDQVTELWFGNEYITDISPVRALVGVKKLGCYFFGRGNLSDLSPLAGMPLTYLHLDINPKIYDVSPLKGMPLTYLHLQTTGVSNLEPLA